MGCLVWVNLILSCTSDLSRNRRLGLALGQGVNMDDAIHQIGQVVESVVTVDALMQRVTQHGLELPITACVHALLHNRVTPSQCLQTLMVRAQKSEFPVSGFASPY